MDVLWAPWRSQYIQGFKDEKTDPNNNPCFICAAFESEDEKNALVVHRAGNCFVLMNKYPYNGGHLLVAPNKHVGALDELSLDELTELMQVVQLSMNALEKISSPHGYNVGMNLGRVSGAGLPGHLHIHIVPRWNGDTSFMSVFSDTKVVSQSLLETQEILAKAFQELTA